MASETSKKQSFMRSVLVILASQVTVKLLGMVYRLVITNIDGFGDMGTGYLNAGYQVYTMLLAISSVGIPNAISKLVSEHAVVGDYRGAHRIFRVALALFAGIGAVCSAFMYFGADFIALTIIKMDGVQYVMKALSPSVIFVCVSSVIRGYFVGLRDVKATSRSQVFEQFFKCTLTILFVYLLIGHAPEIMAAGAQLATSAATMISFVYLVGFYLRRRKKVHAQMDSSEYFPQKYTRSRLAKTILFLSIPISLSSIITAIARVIDTATITRGIAVAFRNGIPGVAGIPTAAQLEETAVSLSGQLSKADVLTNLPLALNIAFATMLVPSVSAALKIGNRKEASEKVSFSLLISILIILPCCIGMIVLAEPIFLMLYPNAPLGASLLQLSCIALIFTALDQTICGALQGLGKVMVPATGLLCGVIVKIIVNNILIRQTGINIYGACIGSICCHVVAFTICIVSLSKSVKINFRLGKFLIRPLIANAVMAAAAWFGYRLLHSVSHSVTVSVLLAICIAVVSYALMLVFLRVMDREDIEQLPGGGRIWRILCKLHLYKA